MKYKLNFELVPDGCWKSNLRNILSKAQWDFLKRDARLRANGKCAICGAKEKQLEAHEVWEYDEINGVQKLKDIIAICKDCHSVIHIGRTQIKGDSIRAENHFMAVNNCTYVEMRKAMGEANLKHQRLNLVSEWSLDISYLKRYIND